MRLLVTAKTRFPGMHNWVDAPDSRNYLRDPHRHLFFVEATVEVTHGDREVEYHDLRDDIQEWIDSIPLYNDFPDTRDCLGKSCEHLAASLAQYLQNEKKLPVVGVSVSEDDEFISTIWLS
jgi:hypothetical protein